MMNIEFMKFPDEGQYISVISDYNRFGDIPLNQSGYPVCEAKTPAFMPGMKRA